jgi:hypothetical protein
MVLNKLHLEIEKVCPIDGVADTGDGTFRIDFSKNATEEQKLDALNVVDKWPLISGKESKLTQIDREWQQLEADGWDSGQGHLGITANDVALLSGCHALGKESAALGFPIPTIVTMENNEITFATMAEFTQLMLQYGAYRAHLSSTFAARRRAVESATTLEELENI